LHKYFFEAVDYGVLVCNGTFCYFWDSLFNNWNAFGKLCNFSSM